MNDYREFLEQQYEARRRAEPGYSRRAFARDLSLSASQLSEVLKGVHGLSAQKAKLVASGLGLAADQTSLFLDLVDAQHARDGRTRKSASDRVARRRRAGFQALAVDSFQFIAEWYHLALLELTKTRTFVPDAAPIARALGIPVEAAWGALGRLRRMGLMKLEKGRLVVTKDRTSTPDDVPSQAIRSFHAQVIGKALTALTKQSVDEREYGTLLLAIRRDQLATAKELIREFQERFSAALQTPGPQDEVYALAVQFFRLSDQRTVGDAVETSEATESLV